MTEIYLDVLIGLNIYITYALFNCCELLIHIHARRFRKVTASFAGGLSSLFILLPQISMFPLTIIRLGLAVILVLIAFGYQNIKRFSVNVMLFFLVNFLFAGVMIACWLLFTPPGMAVRNGVVYFHLSALTLILSTIAASLAVRGLSAIFWRRKPEKLIEKVTVSAGGQETELRVMLDTGNRLFSEGRPVIVCSRQALASVLPPEIISSTDNLSVLSALSGTRWGSRIRMVSCETAAGSTLLPAFRPDALTLADGRQIQCLIALTGSQFCSGEADAAAPPELWQDI